MTDIVDCPSCGRKLQVPASYVGETVQCPQCRHTFVAQGPGVTARPATPAAAPAPRPPKWADEERPRRPSYDEDDLDDDLDVTTREGRYVLPHRSGTILTYGILSLCLFCFPILGLVFGLLALIQGGNDLSAMRAGRMDPEGLAQTQTGRALGTVGLILAVGMFLLVCLARVGGGRF